ncbi:MAG: P-type conjugative transfer protein TrbG [Candidatus Adiutrix sp.]|jgi:type IV secretion system protein VirB9|nr:P-type conjugative transfer protein TrbG [Candidatus Adiutrix sp.]
MKSLIATLLLLATTISGPALAAPAPDFLSPAVIPLSPKEEEALRLSRDWSERQISPLQTPEGKVVYLHGLSLPTVIGAPMQISDIELEPGESVNEILVGDTTRWLVESGLSGGGTTHIFVKPLDAGLQTSLVVTTDRRVYHLKLVSQKEGFNQYIGFLYQGQAKVLADQDRKERQWATGEIGGQAVDLSSLDFNYRVTGKAPWKPVQVFNDGRQTFLRLPDSAAKAEVPVLLALQGRREQIVNYRVHHNTFIVDGLFEHLALISGVGRDQQRVNIRREVKK